MTFPQTSVVKNEDLYIDTDIDIYNFSTFKNKTKLVFRTISVTQSLGVHSTSKHLLDSYEGSGSVLAQCFSACGVRACRPGISLGCRFPCRGPRAGLTLCIPSKRPGDANPPDSRTLAQRAATLASSWTHLGAL